MSEAAVHRTVHERVIDVITELPAIGKDSRMSGGGQSYNYRGIEDIMPYIKTLFAKHGVHVAPSFDILSDTTYEAGAKSTRYRHIILLGAYTVYGAEGDSFVVSAIGEARDTSDKACNKAMTAALKYALMQLLAVADGDDPDAYQSEPATAAPAPPPVVRPIQELLMIRDRLKEVGQYETVAAWALDNGIELNGAEDDAKVAKVVTFARNALGADLDHVGDGL